MPLILRAKCIILGDSAVGKSAIAQSFSSDGIQFPKSYTMNTGVVISVKAVQIQDTDVTVELFIHDSPGKENFFDYAKQFSWNDPDTSQLDAAVNPLAEYRWQDQGSPVGAVVANRIDLDERRVVNLEAGETFASENAFEYFETSAKLHKNCDKPFQVLAAKFYEQYEEKLKKFAMAM